MHSVLWGLMLNKVAGRLWHVNQSSLSIRVCDVEPHVEEHPSEVSLVPLVAGGAVDTACAPEVYLLVDHLEMPVRVARYLNIGDASYHHVMLRFCEAQATRGGVASRCEWDG